MNSRLLISVAVLVVSTQAALAQDCLRVTCGPDDNCEVMPPRLVAALPPGFAISSIRGNTAIATRGDAALLNCRGVSQLPHVISADLASIYGSIHVAGKLQAAGILRFEPNDGGELEFRPTGSLLQRFGRFFKTNFARIKLDQVQPPLKIAPPPSLATADCWQASARAELSDFWVLIGDTSAAGTYAQQARIAQVDRFSRCTWGGE